MEEQGLIFGVKNLWTPRVTWNNENKEDTDNTIELRKIIERLRFTFTPNGKREFVPRDEVFSLFFVYCILFPHKNK